MIIQFLFLYLYIYICTRFNCVCLATVMLCIRTECAKRDLSKVMDTAKNVYKRTYRITRQEAIGASV